MVELIRQAPAKINLALTVGPPTCDATGRRLHPIVSWIHAIAWSDQLRVTLAASGSPAGLVRRRADDALHCVQIDWPVEHDLACRAWLELQRELDRPLPARIEITKRIPPARGLGGGSSDAACVLGALAELFDLPVTHHDLLRIAPRLGADVAFFLDQVWPPRPAIVGGFGEQIERLAPLSGEVVLIVPAVAASTAAVYAARDRLGPCQLRAEAVRRLARAARLDPAGPGRRDPELQPQLFNDLQPAAEALWPELAQLRRRLETAVDRQVWMTGSGSAMFVLCDPGESGAALARRIEAMAPEVDVVPTHLV